jgi:dihydropyrimidine dehydrogenase (NAD+) subunit PreT
MPKVIKGFSEETRTISFPDGIEEAGRCYLCHDAPCCKASPSQTDIPGFISRIRSRNFKGALRLIKESNFFPGITCRVSPYDEQCEQACLRNKYGGPIRIAELERLLTDYDMKTKRPYRPPIPESNGKSVAIVGSGPTGLAAAVELALSGCKVIIYESSRIPGGVLTKGIPSYMISDKVIDHEVGSVLDLGVDLVTGINVGDNINLISLKNSYDALLLTIGMGNAKRLDLPSSNKGEIFTGFDILESLKLKEKRVRVGDKVVIAGGGNVSLDVATSMRKLDIESVTLLYRKDRESMPVFSRRYDICRESGVEILFHTVLKEIKTDSQEAIKQEAIKEVVCQKTELKEEDGALNAVPIEGSEFVIPADTVIYSIGQALDHTLVDLFSLETTEEGRIKVESDTNQTNDPFIFAAGSCVERTNTIIEAIAKGRRAARNIVRHLLD